MEAILQVITNSTLLVTKFFRAGLADNNEHPPFFEQSVYEAEVPEDEALGHTILTVAAHDKDEVSHLRYNITEGNWDESFVVHPIKGDIIIARPLDYEHNSKYNLSVSAFDGRHEAFACVLVDVTDVNDNPPVFDRQLYEASVVEEEDERKLPRKILTVSVTDSDVFRDDRVVFSLSGEGVDVQNPHNSQFTIDPSTGDIYVRKPLDRDSPNGNPTRAMTVFARDEGGEGLVSYSEVLVTVIDINDNPPIFKEEIYHCNVTENDAEGIVVIKIGAEDHDDPSQGTNAQVTYSITKNAVDEATSRPVFTINASTGEIRTSICCLDREKTPLYHLQVVAVDGGSLNGTATVNVHVLDVNDSPPRFSKEFWTAEVDEADGEYFTSKPILNVTVLDDDEVNDFHFKIQETYLSASDLFTIEPISNGVGSVRVLKPLDFEDPLHKLGFKFQIVVSDTGDAMRGTENDHVAYSWVEIKVRDVNDNNPLFHKNTIEVNVSEKIITGTRLSTFVATDRDKEGKSDVSFAIDEITDKHQQFSINKNGVVQLEQLLDRETTPRHVIKIEAIDDGVPPKTSTATLIVNVMDENDSAPRLSQVYHPVLPENQPPSKIIEISATDDDDSSKGNGPPFRFRLDLSSSDDVKSSFKVRYNEKGNGGQGTAIVSSLRGFDREVQKEYYLPIVIEDSGDPPMTGTSTLTITIGDENDSIMQPGEKEVFVYTHKNISQETQIGRVYVHDPDDWDLVDKTFIWASKPHENFMLNEDSGMITMTAATRGGIYFLDFLVQDHKHSQYSVKASVVVSVIYIPENVVRQAASLRIINLSDKDLIRTVNHHQKEAAPRKIDLFRKEVSSLIKADENTVHIFSVNLKQVNPPITDIRFAVYDGQQYQTKVLEGLLTENKEEIEMKIGLSIIMIGINECLSENVPCDGSCNSRLIISDKPYLVDANRTSLVGVDVKTVPDCSCQAKIFSPVEQVRELSCRPNPCKNGGICTKENNSISCQCPGGFQGPRCQIFSRTFEGNGFSWFPSLIPCSENHLSVEFLTVQTEGIIFFNDASANLLENEGTVRDFISLELDHGKPRFLLDYGSSALELRIDNAASVSDGHWHTIDLFWDGENTRIELDHCKEATVQEPLTGTEGTFNTSTCLVSSTISSVSKYLNINSPLQVGGIKHYPFSKRHRVHKLVPLGKPFVGCIRNLRMNGELYDFSRPLLQSHTDMNCNPLEDLCKRNTNSTVDEPSGCGSHGYCDGSIHHPVCVCQAGWSGSKCNDRTTPAFFGNESYVKYALSFKPRAYSMVLQLRFRTWEKVGVLFHISDQSYHEYSALEILNGYLLFRFNTNGLIDDERSITLSYVPVSDGEWHLVTVERYGLNVILMLDGGEGRHYNESYSYGSRHLLIDVDVHEGISLGGKAYNSGMEDTVVEGDFKEGCIDDVRLDGKPLPLPPSVNGTAWAQVTVFQNIVEKCISKDQCLNVECLAPLICKSLWMKHECGCKEGSVLSKDHLRCLEVDVCFHDPCMHGGTCYVHQNSYTCSCPQGYHGAHCQLEQEAPSDFRFTLGALAVILFCIIIILVGMVIFFVYKRRKRRRRLAKRANLPMEGIVKGKDLGIPGSECVTNVVDAIATDLDLTAVIVPPNISSLVGESAFGSHKNAEQRGNLTNVDVIMNVQGARACENLPNILHKDCALGTISASCEGLDRQRLGHISCDCISTVSVSPSPHRHSCTHINKPFIEYSNPPLEASQPDCFVQCSGSTTKRELRS